MTLERNGQKTETGTQPKKPLKRRRVLLALAAVGVLIGAAAFGIHGQLEARRAQRDLELTYERALGDLRSSVGSMALALHKGLYTNTPAGRASFCAQLMRACSLAKGALSVLPVTDDTMNSVSKYVSQVGGFSSALWEKASQGEDAAETDWETLSALSDLAQTLQKDLKEVNLSADGRNTAEAFSQAAEDFADYPTLLYDGPFSDHLYQTEPQLLKGKAEISPEEAQKRAEAFFGSNVQADGEVAGQVPAYRFVCGEAQLSLTKAGGVPLSLINGREILSENLSQKEAQARALSFAEEHGFPSMEPTYWVLQDGKYVFNLAYTEDGVRCYPDLVKVAVAADTGEVVEFSADGFVANHRDRNLKAPAHTAEEATAAASPKLRVESSRRAVIPTLSGEVQAYELHCRGEKGEQLLLYLHADTLEEEAIFFLEESASGVLVQ